MLRNEYEDEESISGYALNQCLTLLTGYNPTMIKDLILYNMKKGVL